MNISFILLLYVKLWRWDTFYLKVILAFQTWKLKGASDALFFPCVFVLQNRNENYDSVFVMI